MFHRLIVCSSAVGLAIVSTNVSASPLPAGAPFAAAPVSEQTLGAITGTGAPYTPLSRSNLTALADNQSRNDFRFIGSTGGLQMEVWWGSIGSELIANAVRGQPS